MVWAAECPSSQVTRQASIESMIPTSSSMVRLLSFRAPACMETQFIYNMTHIWHTLEIKPSSISSKQASISHTPSLIFWDLLMAIPKKPPSITFTTYTCLHSLVKIENLLPSIAHHAGIHLGVHHLYGGHGFKQPKYVIVQKFTQLQV